MIPLIDTKNSSKEIIALSANYSYRGTPLVIFLLIGTALMDQKNRVNNKNNKIDGLLQQLQQSPA
jgi:hypothetical protein